MQPPLPWAWAFWTGAAALGLLSAGLLIRALIWDRSCGRRRCPRCWYDMSGAPGLTCPECGHDAKREARLHKTRRRWRIAGLALVTLIGSATLWAAPYIKRDGWYRHTPTTALIVIIWCDPYRTPEPDGLVMMALQDGHVWHWQKRWLAHIWSSRLRNATGPAQRQELLSPLGLTGLDGAAAVPLVLPLLADDDEDTRLFAWSVLARIGVQDPDALRAINALLIDPQTSSLIRAMVVNRVRHGRAASVGVVPSLIQIIERPELHSADLGRILDGAAYSLGRIGLSAKAALPALMNLAAESLANAPRRYEALRAISLIRGDAANAVSFDVGMIRGNDHELRAIAIDQVAYGDEGDGRSAAIPALLEAMGDDSPKVRALAASGLRLILDEEKGARAALERTARRAESPLRERAAEILQAGPRQRESFGGSVSPPPAAPAPASGK